MSTDYITLNEGSDKSRPVKAWTNGVQVEGDAQKQLFNVASMPEIVGPHVAVMPDVHWGRGATVGSVIPTTKAIIPAAVGVDIGCGMIAAKLSVSSSDLTKISVLRHSIERSVPVGFSEHHEDRIPLLAIGLWEPLRARLEALQDTVKNRKGDNLSARRARCQIGTLGGGNHFIEICEDQEHSLWIMLHSGSRGIGNQIGSYFIDRAKEDMARLGLSVPDKDLSYVQEGSPNYDAYIAAVQWAQDYALTNRAVMFNEVLRDVYYHFDKSGAPEVQTVSKIIQCHHNYISRETHYGQDMWITRKGAVRARKDELVIIPGSMGTKSYIARGLGNPESFESCSHGAGRAMSRGAAKRAFSVTDLETQTAGVECRKDSGVLDEIPGAYKPIEDVMAAQATLVTPVFELKQLLCVKG